MPIVLTGVSHRSAPFSDRELLSLTSEELPSALERLGWFTEHGVIVSTCNRTEFYTVAKDGRSGADALDRFIESQFRLDIQAVRPSLYTLHQDAAVNHLFRVACSLDSQILGESEVLGQVRDAFGIASQRNIAGGALAHLFHSAIRTGKRARTETTIGRHALSVSRACIELVRRTLGPLETMRALIIGVGEASRLAGLALRDRGVNSLTVANRTPDNATALADELGAAVTDLGDLKALIVETDVVITATAAPDFILSAELIQDAMLIRDGRPLMIIDIAVPRDVEPAASELPGVHIFVLDDLEAIAEANRLERESEVAKVELIVAEELERFRSWWGVRAVTPTIAAIRHRAEEVRASEVAKAIEQMASPEDAARLEKMTKALVKKLLHQPTASLRSRNDEAFTRSARDLFGLDA